MRHVAIALACLATFASPSVYARDAAVEAPITTFVVAFNKGDVAGALATMADTVTIADEIAPFHWEGADAFRNWGADYETDAKARGITDPSVKIGPPIRELVAGDTAYVIVPATYRFKQQGVAMVEVAQMTFTLTRKGYDRYRIASWTWTGPTPVRAK